MADPRTILAQRGQGDTSTSNIQTGTQAFLANTARSGWVIQNGGVNILYGYLGNGTTVTFANYNFALKACTATNDGTGGSISQTYGVVFTGPITVGGTSPSYSVMEFS